MLFYWTVAIACLFTLVQSSSYKKEVYSEEDLKNLVQNTASVFGAQSKEKEFLVKPISAMQKQQNQVYAISEGGECEYAFWNAIKKSVSDPPFDNLKLGLPARCDQETKNLHIRTCTQDTVVEIVRKVHSKSKEIDGARAYANQLLNLLPDETLQFAYLLDAVSTGQKSTDYDDWVCKTDKDTQSINENPGFELFTSDASRVSGYTGTAGPQNYLLPLVRYLYAVRNCGVKSKWQLGAHKISLSDFKLKYAQHKKDILRTNTLHTHALGSLAFNELSFTEQMTTAADIMSRMGTNSVGAAARVHILNSYIDLIQLAMTHLAAIDAEMLITESAYKMVISAIRAETGVAAAPGGNPLTGFATRGNTADGS